MALHFALKVNTETIGYFSAVRTSIGSDDTDVNEYRIELRDEGDQSTRVAHINHRYDDGALDLVIAGLQAIKTSEGESK